MNIVETNLLLSLSLVETNMTKEPKSFKKFFQSIRCTDRGRQLTFWGRGCGVVNFTPAAKIQNENPGYAYALAAMCARVWNVVS